MRVGLLAPASGLLALIAYWPTFEILSRLLAPETGIHVAGAAGAFASAAISAAGTQIIAGPLQERNERRKTHGEAINREAVRPAITYLAHWRHPNLDALAPALPDHSRMSETNLAAGIPVGNVYWDWLVLHERRVGMESGRLRQHAAELQTALRRLEDAILDRLMRGIQLQPKHSHQQTPKHNWIDADGLTRLLVRFFRQLRTAASLDPEILGLSPQNEPSPYRRVRSALTDLADCSPADADRILANVLNIPKADDVRAAQDSAAEAFASWRASWVALHRILVRIDSHGRPGGTCPDCPTLRFKA